MVPRRLGPRFALEALFLILLAVGAGFADLSTQAIVLIMVVAWVLVALLEFTSDRLAQSFPPLRRYHVPAQPAELPPGPQPPDSATVIVAPPPQAPAEAQPVESPEPVVAEVVEASAPVAPEVAEPPPPVVVAPPPPPPEPIPLPPAPEPASSEPDVEAEQPMPQAQPGVGPESRPSVWQRWLRPTMVETGDGELPPQPRHVRLLARRAAEPEAGEEPPAPPEEEGEHEPEPEVPLQPPASPTPAPGIADPGELELPAAKRRRFWQRRAGVEGEDETGGSEPQSERTDDEAEAAEEEPGKTRWQRWRSRSADEGESETDEESPAQPRHVRLLPRRVGTSRAEREVAEIFDSDDGNERQHG